MSKTGGVGEDDIWWIPCRYEGVVGRGVGNREGAGDALSDALS